MTGLTPGGLPFPDGNDRVVDGDNAIRALAEFLDPYVADTGWVDVPIAAGFAALSENEKPQVRRIGFTVWPKGAWGPTGVSANNEFTVTTLPVGFRPAQITMTPIGTWTTDNRGIFVIETGGIVHLRVGPTNPHYFWSAPWIASATQSDDGAAAKLRPKG